MNSQVLLVDGDQRELARYWAALTGEGFRVVAASSGLDCLSRLRESGPAVLVMDPQLLWGSGEDVVALMRGTADFSHIPRIILTDMRVWDDDAGAFWDCTVLSKPAHPATLACVVRALSEHRPWRRG